MKRFFALLLALLTLTPVLLACEDNETPDDTSDSVSVSNTESSATEELKPDLPDVTFGGETYTILAAAEEWLGQYYIAAEDIEGEIVAQAVHDRNEAVSKQYDIVLDYVPFGGFGANIQKVGMALNDSISGDGTYDLVVGSISYLAVHIPANYYKDLNTADHLGFDQPWWFHMINDQITISGRQYLASGYYDTNGMSGAMVVFYNKKLLEDNALEELYPIVEESKWTIDKMIELSEIASRDVNNDNLYDESDVFGIVSTYDYAVNLVSAFDHTFVSRNDDGRPTLTGATEKMVNINDKLYEVFSSDYYIDTYTLSSDSSIASDKLRAIFANNQSLFLMHRISCAEYPVLRDMSADYGIIPMPKWDEEQTLYITSLTPDALGIPSYVENIDFSTIICEALVYESYRTVRPAYYEEALQGKYSRDPQTAEMIDLLMENTITDFAYIYNRIIGNSLIYYTGKANTYTSWAAANLPAFQVKLDELIETVEALPQ